MEKVRKVVTSQYPPKQTNVVWIDTSNTQPAIKLYIKGKWQVAESNELTPEQIAYIISQVDISGKADKEVTPTIIIPSVDGKPTHMTSDEIAGLKVGDVIISKTLTGDVNFYVTKISGNESGSIIYAVNVNGNRIVTMTFINTNGTWAYQDSSTLYITTTLVNTIPQSGMLPNTLYSLGELATDTTFVMSAAEDNTIANIWTWTFSTGSTAPTITWPAEITMWNGGEIPEIEANKYYEVSVMNGVGTVISADIPQTEVEP